MEEFNPQALTAVSQQVWWDPQRLRCFTNTVKQFSKKSTGNFVLLVLLVCSLYETKMPNLLLFVACDGTLNILSFRITGQIKRTILTFVCWTFFSDFIDQRIHQLVKKISDIGTVFSVQMILSLLLLIPTIPSPCTQNIQEEEIYSALLPR